MLYQFYMTYISKGIYTIGRLFYVETHFMGVFLVSVYVGRLLSEFWVIYTSGIFPKTCVQVKIILI